MEHVTETHCESVYRTLHYSDPNYRNANQGLATIYDWVHLLKDAKGAVYDRLTETCLLNVVDVGCGNGKLCDFLSDLMIDVTGLDIAKGPYDRSKYKFVLHDLNETPLPFGNDEFDYCLCFDVAEHLAEEKVPPLLKELSRVGRNVLLKVACYGVPPLHLTVKSPGWWLDAILTACPERHWQMLRSHERFIGKYAPLFYGKKKKEY